MIPRTAMEIAQAIGGTVHRGEGSLRALAVSIDSRTTATGDAFFAIVGPRHDGHRFVAQAAGRGAPIAVISKDVEAAGEIALVRCADTTEALGALAADERRRRDYPVVAVTGSSGKTTTRTLITAALSARFRVGSTSGNLNNQWGLPLSLLNLTDQSELAVVELGMNHTGEIAELTRIATPNVGVITNVGRAHLGHFRDLAEIARAKVELLEEMDEQATGVVPAADKTLMDLARATGKRLVTFGVETAADIEATQVFSEWGTGCRFSVSGIEVRLRLWGRHAAGNAVAALAAAHALGLSIEEAAPRLEEVEPLPGRGKSFDLGGGGLLVDESYNSNPTAALAVLAELESSTLAGRKVAVLGDMLELGVHAQACHEEIGAAAARAADLLVAVGEYSGAMGAAARRAGLGRVICHRESEEAAEALGSWIRDGDLVLVKGSHGVRLERVVEALLAGSGATRS